MMHLAPSQIKLTLSFLSLSQELLFLLPNEAVSESNLVTVTACWKLYPPDLYSLGYFCLTRSQT